MDVVDFARVVYKRLRERESKILRMLSQVVLPKTGSSTNPW